MATDFLTFIPSSDISVAHTISPTTITNAYSALIDNTDDTYIQAVYDPSSNITTTTTSKFELGAIQIPKAFQMNITECVLSFRCNAINSSYGSGSHDLTLYLDNTEIGSISIKQPIDLVNFNFRPIDSDVSSISTQINSYLQENNYRLFPALTLEISSAIKGAGANSTSTRSYVNISEVQLTVNYETDDNDSILHKKILLRPSADVSVANAATHSKYPSESEYSYLLVNEEVADDGATYISIEVEKSGYTGYATSSFAMSGTVPKRNIKITNFKFVYRYATGGTLISSISDTATISIGGISTSSTYSVAETSTSGSDYETTEITAFDNSDAILTELNKLIKSSGTENLSGITLTLSTSLSTSENTKTSNNDVRYTQLYLELNYEETDIGVCIKSDNSWLTATQAFRKQDGTWIEITADECKALLQEL